MTANVIWIHCTPMIVLDPDHSGPTPEFFGDREAPVWALYFWSDPDDLGDEGCNIDGPIEVGLTYVEAEHLVERLAKCY